MRRAECEEERDELESIAATLLCLAVLAEFLCIVPFRLRILILSLLRPAEAVARAFAMEQSGALALPPSAVPGLNGDGCAEALRLALCFRLLASIIVGLQAFTEGQQRFRRWQNWRLAQCAPAIAWQNHAMRTRRAMASCGAVRIDTS